MELEFLGGCKEVGRSAFLLEHKNTRILLDAGIKLSLGGDECPLIDESLAKKIDYVIITHAHLDHVGYLGFLEKYGFNGNIICTKPTRDLTQLLLADYAKVSKLQKKKTYSNKEITGVLKKMEFVKYREPIKIKDLKITLLNAGHILGSSMILIEGKKTLLYTGDLNYRETNLLYPADNNIPEIEYLIIESTYGGKNDRIPSLKSACKQIADVIKETVDTGGKVLIPSFGVGRAQEVMVTIHNYMRSGYIPEVPCYIDGMINKANRIYRQNVLDLREEIWKRILLNDDDPFRSKYFRVPRTKTRVDVLKNQSAVILTTSGMLTGGPSLMYLEKLASDPKNTILLVGYQVENTLGRLLQEGEKELVLPNGNKIEVKAKVETVHLSAHADRTQLVNFISKISIRKTVFVVHGEEEKSKDLAKTLEKRDYSVKVPTNGTGVQL